MAFDLSGKYLYVAAYTRTRWTDLHVGANGVPVRSTVAASVQTGTGPTCVTVSGAPSNANPTHAVYLYTSNALSNNLTGEQLNQADGSLDQILGTPFGGSALPDLRRHSAGVAAAMTQLKTERLGSETNDRGGTKRQQQTDFQQAA